MTIDELLAKLLLAKADYGGNAKVLVSAEDDEEDLPYHKAFGLSWHPTVNDDGSYWPEGTDMADGPLENGVVILCD